MSENAKMESHGWRGLYRSENKHRFEDTDKGIWPLGSLADGPDCLSKFSKKRGGGTQGRR